MKKRIGFDLDGIFVDKPPLVPKSLLEWLFKGGQKGLHYRFPRSKVEQLVRKLSHFYLIRPPLKKNLSFVLNELQRKPHRLFLISSRYSFLEKETQAWLKKRGLDQVFTKVYLNLQDEPPHLFKEKAIKELKLDWFFEDDPEIADYLQARFPKRHIFCYSPPELSCKKAKKTSDLAGILG